MFGNIPDDFPIDFVVAVYDTVAQSNHPAPRYLRVCLLKGLGYAVRGFPQNDQLPENG